jgi:hypothetical protein
VDQITENPKTVQKSQMASNRCFSADRGKTPLFGMFLAFLGEKVVRRKLCKARSRSGAYIYTGEEFLRGRQLGWMMSDS